MESYVILIIDIYYVRLRFYIDNKNNLLFLFYKNIYVFVIRCNVLLKYAHYYYKHDSWLSSSFNYFSNIYTFNIVVLKNPNRLNSMTSVQEGNEINSSTIKQFGTTKKKKNVCRKLTIMQILKTVYKILAHNL